MAKGSLNKVMLIGNVGQDVKYTNNGTAVAKISIATSEVDKDKVEHTEWHNVTFFGKLADIVHQYVSKGTKLYVEGRMKLNKWEDKHGAMHYATDIIASQMQLLGGKKKEETGSSEFDDSDIPF